MQTVTTKAMAKVAAVATGLAMATSMLSLAPIAHAAALTDAQVQSILSLLSSFGADSSTIANVNASLTGGTPVSTGGSMSSSVTFTKDLTVGSTGAEVTALQNALKAGGYMSANATGYFGALTQAGVSAWQKAMGVSPAAGYFGAKSRAAFGGTTSSTGGTTTTTGGMSAGTGTGLKVMLATDSPNNVALVQSQATGEIAKYTFSNPTGTDVKVTNISFKRIGVSTDSALSNVYLFKGEMRITDPAGISNSTFTFNDATGIFTVPAGGVVAISVRADIAGSTSGQQIGVQLTALTSSGTLDSSVSLPINSYTQTVSSASLAAVALGTVTPTGSTFSPGADTTLFQSTATVSTRAVWLKAVTFENRGSTVDADFQNLKLLVKGTQVGVTMSGTMSKKVTFDLSANPVRLETGGNEIRLQGDVVGGSGETFDFQIRRDADIRFIDVDLNAAVDITGSTAAAAANSIDGVALSVTRAANSPTSNVAVDATNVKWGSFEFRATGDDLKVEQVTVDTDLSAGSGLDNGKVFLNGVQIGSTQDIVSAGTTVFTFGSQMIIKRGTVAVIDVYSDAKQADGTSIAAGATVDVGVSVAVADTEGVDSGDRIGSAISEVEGNSITVSSSSLTATKYSGYSDQTIIAGTNDAKIGSFTLSTGSTEGVNVNTIVVDFASAVTSTMSDLRLVDNATGASIGTTKSSVSTSNSFSVSGVNLATSGTKTINVIANIKSGSNIGAIPATTVTTSTGGVGAVTGNSVTVASAPTLQTITIGSAVLTVAVNDGSTPDSANVIAGSAEVKVGSFRFTAQYSPYTVQEVKVKVPSGSSTSVTAVTLKWPGGSATQALSLASGASQSYSTATFTGLTFAVPMNTDTNLDVYVGIPTVASGATSGSGISVVLDADEGFKAVDSSGASDTSLNASDLNSAATTGKGTMYVRKSIPTVSAVALDSGTLTAGSNKAIARVKVTADAAGDVSWNKIVFTVSKTAAITLDATTTVKLYDGANSIAGSFATTTGSQAGQSQMFTVVATSGFIVFEPTSEQTVAAGTSKTYELRTTVGGLGSGSNTLDVSVANPTTSVTTGTASAVAGSAGASTPSVVWSDRSVISSVHSTSTSDWTNDYLVKTLPLTVGNMSVTI